jgi:hypothetical protein
VRLADGGVLGGGGALDAASKVRRWQQAAAPAEEQAPLAGAGTDSR